MKRKPINVQFDQSVTDYVDIYARPSLPTSGCMQVDGDVQIGIPDGWLALTPKGVRNTAKVQGRNLIIVFEKSHQTGNVTSSLVFEECWDDPAGEFRPGIPLWDIAQDRAATTPGRLAAPPVEFGVGGAYACYMPIVAQSDVGLPALFAAVVVKGRSRAYPINLFTPWNDAQMSLPALRSVLDSWHWI